MDPHKSFPQLTYIGGLLPSLTVQGDVLNPSFNTHQGCFVSKHDCTKDSFLYFVHLKPHITLLTPHVCNQIHVCADVFQSEQAHAAPVL